MTKRRTNRLVELAQQDGAKDSAMVRKRRRTFVVRPSESPSLPPASRCLLFLLDVSSVLSLGAEVFESLIRRHLAQETSGRVVWGFRLFDSRDGIGCTPDEFDRLVGRHQPCLFKEVNEKELKRFHRALSSPRLGSVFLASKRERSLGSSPLSRYAIFQAAIQQTINSFNWDDHSSELVTREMTKQTEVSSLIVLCPAPQSTEELDLFISQSTTILHQHHVENDRVSTRKSATLDRRRTKLESALSFLEQHGGDGRRRGRGEGNGRLRFYWIDTFFPAEDADPWVEHDQSALALLDGVLASKFSGRLLPLLAFFKGQSKLVPSQAFPSLFASVTCRTHPSAKTPPSPQSASPDLNSRNTSNTPQVIGLLNRSDSVKSSTSISTSRSSPPTQSSPLVAASLHENVFAGGFEGGLNGEMVCRMADGKGIEIPIKLCDIGVVRVKKDAKDNEDATGAKNQQARLVLHGLACGKEARLDMIKNDHLLEDSLFLCFCASASGFAAFAECMKQLEANASVALGSIFVASAESEEDDVMQVALYPLTQTSAVIHLTHCSRDVVDRVFGTPIDPQPSPQVVPFIPRANDRILATSLDRFVSTSNDSEFACLLENGVAHPLLQSTWLSSLPQVHLQGLLHDLPSAVDHQSNQSHQDMEHLCGKVFSQLETSWNTGDDPMDGVEELPVSTTTPNHPTSSAVSSSSSTSSSLSLPSTGFSPPKPTRSQEQLEMSYSHLLLKACESQQEEGDLIDHVQAVIDGLYVPALRSHVTTKWLITPDARTTCCGLQLDSFSPHQRAVHLKTQVFLRFWLNAEKKKDPVSKSTLKELKKLLTLLGLVLQPKQFTAFFAHCLSPRFTATLPKTMAKLSSTFDLCESSEEPIEFLSLQPSSTSCSNSTTASTATNGTKLRALVKSRTSSSARSEQQKDSGNQTGSEESPQRQGALAEAFGVKPVVNRMRVVAHSTHQSNPLVLKSQKYALNHFTAGLSNVSSLLRQRKVVKAKKRHVSSTSSTSAASYSHPKFVPPYHHTPPRMAVVEATPGVVAETPFQVTRVVGESPVPKRTKKRLFESPKRTYARDAVVPPTPCLPK